MDSAQLHQSGLLNPADAAQSLLQLKATNATPHGGGLIAAYTGEDQALVNGWIRLLPPVAEGVVEAIKVGQGTSLAAPRIDGFFDVVWAQAPAARFRVTGGWGDADYVTVKAAYDATYLYMLVAWDDDQASFRKQPWMKQANGSWATVHGRDPSPSAGMTWQQYVAAVSSFDEEDPAHFNYEDRLAIMWNTYGATAVPGFDESGCAVACHDPGQAGRPGMTYNFVEEWKASKMFTPAPGAMADVWHWKSLRSDPYAKLDDQFVQYWVVGPAGPTDAGRAIDDGASGSGPNPVLNGRPMYRGPSLTAPPYYILDNQKIPATDAELAALPVGAQIPNTILSGGPTGARADVDAKGLHSAGAWGLEIRRKLLTGDPHDVQFDSFARRFSFGIAVFDNAELEHRYMPMVGKLVFRP